MNNNKKKLGRVLMLSGGLIMVLIAFESVISIYLMVSDRGSALLPSPFGGLFLLLGVGVWGTGLVIIRKSPDSWETVYKGHKIRVENEIACERLFVDGELQDEKKGLKPLKLSSHLQGKIKNEAGEDELVEAKIGGFLMSRCQLSVNKVPIDVTES